MKRIVCLLLAAILSPVMLTACRDRLAAIDTISGGEAVGVKDLESIRQSLEETETAAQSKLVYWIDGGSGTTYHTHADCPYLEGKKVVSGEKIDAFAACKMDLCSRCAERDGVTPEW